MTQVIQSMRNKITFSEPGVFDSQCRLKTLKKYRCAQKVIMVAFETTSISDLTYMLTAIKKVMLTQDSKGRDQCEYDTC
jgi:hypothetical protein